WPSGFQAEVQITNRSTRALDNWQVQWAFPDGQTVTALWNGAVTQSGANVTVRNMAWNGAVPAGGTVSFGYIGSFGTKNGAPTPFTLNGMICR
ncbi:MAG TPA: cellulose binding domain-containing protein, partial [Actinoplanes sp.]|nr:cellulose binding domain-containing protein [Actinoplanes sp.]